MNKFRVVVHNCKITTNRWKKKLLQFTWTVILEHPLGEFGFSVEHCLCYYSSSNILRWHPPINYITGGRLKQLHTLSDQLYKLTLNALNKTDPIKNNVIQPNPSRVKNVFIKDAPELETYADESINLKFDDIDRDSFDIPVERYVVVHNNLTETTQPDRIESEPIDLNGDIP